MDFPTCNLIVLSCQYESMAVTCMESGYLSTCVSTLSAYFLDQCVFVCMSVCACVTVCNVCMPTFPKFPCLSVNMCARACVCVYVCLSQAFLDRGNLSASMESFQRPPPHTHKHTSHIPLLTHACHHGNQIQPKTCYWQRGRDHHTSGPEVLNMRRGQLPRSLVESWQPLNFPTIFSESNTITKSSSSGSFGNHRLERPKLYSHSQSALFSHMLNRFSVF